MSVEQKLPFQIPRFEDDPRDAQMGDSQIIRSAKEVNDFWRDRYEETNSTETEIPAKKTYDQDICRAPAG